MTLAEHLELFYQKYDLPANGGENHNSFEVPLPIFTLTLPNLSWRKKMLYVHDLEHILNDQDTTWKGEMFIASWEIASGFWKNFPIIIFPLWTMGWGIWKHPKSVLEGFKAGNSSIGIANLDINKQELLALNLSELKELTKRTLLRESRFFVYFKLLIWIIISQFVFLMPIIILFSILFIIF
jgi:hypothetical protein